MLPELEPLTTIGIPGIITALLVLITVTLAKRARLVITGNHARIANILLSLVLSTLSANGPQEQTLIAAIASLLSALLYELYKYLVKTYA